MLKDHLNHPVTLIGVGGIGSNVLPLILRFGVGRLTIWDDDVVEEVNLSTQQHTVASLGKSKAATAAETVRAVNPDTVLDWHPRRFCTQDALDGIIISGVDSGKSRMDIWHAIERFRDRIPLYIDGRLSRRHPEWLQLFTVNPSDEEVVAAYREFLFSDEGLPEHPRSERPAVHTPYLLAGLIGANLARWVQNERYPWQVTLDCTTYELVPYYFSS